MLGVQATDGNAAIGSEDREQVRGYHLQVPSHRSRQEVEDHQQGLSLPLSLSHGDAGLTRRQVDPSIIGGLVVEVGDRTIDLSISSKMAKLNKVLTDAL